jgi:hypothetical protein
MTGLLASANSSRYQTSIASTADDCKQLHLWTDYSSERAVIGWPARHGMDQPLERGLSLDPHSSYFGGGGSYLVLVCPAQPNPCAIIEGLQIGGENHMSNRGDGKAPADMFIWLPVHDLLKGGEPIRNALGDSSDATPGRQTRFPR